MAKKSTSKKIGRGLAVFQAFVDDVLDFSFKTLKSFGKTSKKQVKKDGELKKTAKNVAKFLGETGEYYYSEYAKIKTKKTKKTKG